MTVDEALSRPTISVPDAGALFFGLKRQGAYEAAKRGDIPTIKLGRRMVVPVVALAEKLGLKARVGEAA
ncbi:MerR family transcriptional regulator [Aureimonas psammosilenae]|uniref:DNA-binding protein n=1 Tax=Aureimonas psammosilenae TaxID=2495496 RepID=UPI00126064C8|nr:DNA-binding protein [Aureimonas psammosilenae]